MNSINSIKLFSILTTLAGLVFYGASAFTQGYEIPDPDAGAGAKGLPTNFITPQELKKLIDEGSDKIIIVDNAPAEAFEEEHIPGAVNLPWVQAIRPPIKLPHNKTLILYCPCGPGDADSIDMSKKLKRFGYFNTKVLEGGYFKWLDLGYPIASKDKED